MKKRSQAYLIFAFLFALAMPIMAQEQAPMVNNKPIRIDADNQEIDIQNNSITFTGNVIIEQDTMKVMANRVVITNMQNKEEQRITAYGSPVKFNQVMPNNKLVDGHASQLVYDVKNNSITLTGNAQLKQLDNVIESQMITYNIDQQQILAKGDRSNRVKTTIVPNQVTEINK